ncbi:MAG TPA: ATP-binding cassette domain-containing protein [Rubrivivax sp.]|nr:ATP-binding cassette domain-containing protein [Rubrivivax sp.]HPO18648.1 ATP-binding cassette domain-containing protein [Rubrivivax sp.]
MSEVPLLQVEDLVKHYRLPRERLLAAPPVVQALQGVSLQLQRARSLGVVGESGCGKSTLARLVMALEAPSAGRVLLAGADLHALPAAALRRARAQLQMVFQDPYGSLDPRRSVLHTVSEPLRVLHRAGAAEQRERAAAVLDAVGLRSGDLAKYPHEFSGGQRQRIAIARALITQPKLIVADEPVSALDVSVQAQVLNLMRDLQDRLGLALLFISHDLAVVDLVCDEVVVLYQGRIVERGAPRTLFVRAAHPYTRALLQAVPRLRPGKLREVRPKAPARPFATADVSAGCAFAPRCAFAEARCVAQRPLLRTVDGEPGHEAACHFAERIAAMPQND